MAAKRYARVSNTGRWLRTKRTTDWHSSIAISSQRPPALMPQTRFKHAAGERDFLPPLFGARTGAHAMSRPPSPYGSSLPLDGARRLGGYVVDHAVDALDLVDDAGGRAPQHLVRERV